MEVAEEQESLLQAEEAKEETAPQEEKKPEEPKEELAQVVNDDASAEGDKSVERPSSASQRPSSGTQRPASGTQRPGSGTQRPGSGTVRPGSGTVSPSAGTQRPSSGTQRPGSGVKRPSSGTQRPSSGSQRPVSATIRPPSASSNSSRSTKQEDTNSLSSTAQEKAGERPSSARSKKESPRQEPAPEAKEEPTEQTETPKEEPAEENNNEVKKEEDSQKPKDEEKKSPESTPRKEEVKEEQPPTGEVAASQGTGQSETDSARGSEKSVQGEGEVKEGDEAKEKEVKKKKPPLTVEEVEQKATALMDTLLALETYDNDETMTAMKAVGQLYWNHKSKRHVIVNVLIKMGFPELSVKFVVAFNKIGLFKSDSVWFPAYYTMNNMWNYSDGSRELAKELVGKGIIPLMLANITHQPYLDNLKSKNVNYVIKSSLSILQNVGKIPESKNIFLENNAIEALKPFTTSENVFLKTVSMMVLTTIINEAENAVLEDTGTIPFMVKGIGLALDAANGRYRGFTPTELAECLGRMAVNDSNKMKIVDEGALPLFVRMLQRKKAEEHAASAQCLWTLSFDKDVRQKILDEPGCVDTLETLVESEDKAVRLAAKGALWKLKKEEEHDKNREAKSKEEEDKDEGHIMISYNWGSQETVIQIANKLKENGYKVWLDVDQMGGSTLEAMAQAVERAKAVIICMSEKYKISPNCRTEGEYTFQLRKPIVPLLMQRKYKPDGWLGMLLGAKLFIDYSGKHPFDKAYNMMIKELNGVIDPGHSGVVQAAQASVTQTIAPGPSPRAGPRPQSASSAALVALSKQQVAQWLADNGLQGCQERFAEMDGKLLAALLTIRMEAPEYFYRTLETKFCLDPFDVLRMIHAMTALP